MKNYSVLAGMFFSLVVILVVVTLIQSDNYDKLKHKLEEDNTNKVMFMYTNVSKSVTHVVAKPDKYLVNYGQLVITNYGQIILPNGQVVQP